MSTTNPTEITTQWEDQMVKRGIWAPREQEKRNEELYEERMDALESINIFENAKLEKLIDIEVDKDESFEKELDAIRARRLASLKNKAEENSRFGELYFIRKPDFVREVTEASKDNTTVVVHLYKESNEDCQIINRILAEKIAKEYGKIKFVKGISNDIVPNYPDKSLPTMIIYRNGTSISQITGSSSFKDKNRKITIKSILKLFAQNNVIKHGEIREYSELGKGSEHSNFHSSSDISDDSDDDRDNGKCYSSLAFDKINDRIKYLQKI
ncbi:phosducin related thioredoxin fold [Cryptosporidium sp. chipmunk genotype I]|uniref:phosducin related thioredoxin fold n=1 Tax=Cryptosporidium sp. chipmunk genotype I TaxID=1280935 RepID=UPI003519ECF1|nr:phosducin related thioredoxin fold [Cryptosporidium sp. chipmunk genotype I]